MAVFEIQLIDIDYQIEDGEVYIRGFGKTSEDENILFYDREFLPYLYAVPEKDKDIGDLRQKIQETDFSNEGTEIPVRDIETEKVVDGSKEIEALKVFSNIPAMIPKLKNELWDLPEVKECREFDIPFYRRYLVDREIRPGSWIQVEGKSEDGEIENVLELESIETGLEKETGIDWYTAAFDLEVYQDEIIMVSIYSEDLEKVITTEKVDRSFVETVESEKELIKSLVEILEDRDIDVLTGYNTDEFDFDILRKRAEHHNLNLEMGRDGERMKFNRRGRFKGARLKGRMHLDIYPFVSHVLAPGLDSETLDLDSVSEELLGLNKDDMSWEEMKASWKNKEDLEKFSEYALKDSELAYKLAEELVPQILELSEITGLIPFDACRLTYGQLTENYLIREARDRNMLAPNRPSQDKRSKRRRQDAYSGGFVYTPEAGLYEEIGLFDFKSLYPTVMVAHNISPDTLNTEDCENRFSLEKFDYDFCQDETGFFPELVRELVEDRSKIKNKMRNLEEDSQEYKSLDNRQQAEKILANSFYGYLGYSGARWYSRECAEATTYMGREYIHETIEIAEEMDFEVVYGDTDSVFLKAEDIGSEADSFLDRVNSSLPEFMKLELEGIFTRGFFTSTDSGEGAKKKYALLSEDGDMKITGFEQVRRDWSPVAKNTQKEVLRKVLEDNIGGAVEEAKQTVEDLRRGNIPVEQLKIFTTLTKKPENYESTAPHVEAAKKAIKQGKDIGPGDTVAYVITRGGGTISSRAETVENAQDYDSDYYIENQVLPAAVRVLKVFGYTEGQLKGEGKQSGLGRFS